MSATLDKRQAYSQSSSFSFRGGPQSIDYENWGSRYINVPSRQLAIENTAISGTLASMPMEVDQSAISGTLASTPMEVDQSTSATVQPVIPRNARPQEQPSDTRASNQGPWKSTEQVLASNTGLSLDGEDETWGANISAPLSSESHEKFSSARFCRCMESERITCKV